MAEQEWHLLLPASTSACAKAMPSRPTSRRQYACAIGLQHSSPSFSWAISGGICSTSFPATSILWVSCWFLYSTVWDCWSLSPVRCLPCSKTASALSGPSSLPRFHTQYLWDWMQSLPIIIFWTSPLYSSWWPMWPLRFIWDLPWGNMGAGCVTIMPTWSIRRCGSAMCWSSSFWCWLSFMDLMGAIWLSATSYSSSSLRLSASWRGE